MHAGAMARPPREEGADAIHHVIPRGHGDKPIVLDDRDRRAYLTRFACIRRELGWLSHASCLLDTHHHAVVETSESNLGLGMRRLLGGHSRWVNVRHERKGSVFTPHFWSRRIKDDAWFFRACIYVVLNPVAAGICAHPAEWPWCSYRVTAEGDPDAYSPGEERLLSMFGATPSEARRCYTQVVQAAVDGILAERQLTPRALWYELGELEQPITRLVSDVKSDTGSSAPPWCPT
jgi:REP element-mobilizing transposase RayT